ncbi:MAG TPA: carboxypeptidase-like regulatory domain-containing protein [Verrucomicrobiae bacterium]
MMDLEYPAYRTTTDENGRFIFPQVPTGSLDIVVWRKSTASESSFGSHVQTVEIQPGETRQVEVVVPSIRQTASSGGK